MGYFGKLYDKLKAQELRRQGYSYKEILQHVSVSKDTLSRWCKDIVLTNEQKNRLIKNKKIGQKKGSLIAAENKRQKRLQNIETIRKIAEKEIGTLVNREKFLAGIALYAAEGIKMDGKGGFSNADPKLIQFMTKWFNSFAEIPISKLRGRIWLHEGLSENNAKTFWSDITGIPTDQFIKTYFTKRKADSKRVRKNIHQYGIFAITFHDAAIHRKIMGWISAVFNAKISNVDPR